ncbi:MAG: indole-3-glycerol phosphate synthase TrpC [Flavobacteriales bacterium]|jgi:indole-3-glycerol phosphate synthase|uniref:indole-3-glycerol phosphate synthase TrpC n=1 Tax=Candidatus Ulvibacter alkanivorans TaxID=2267620 RepID=UPI000DF2144E|nr:indole-3-glycerol phosphate synthase TrpC [Candidatus Ulvibacter alkanivorans]MCH2491005.1 indole-3-glycerol phosphate synthase TrpC [Flavobacteriales bacterium]
MTILDKITAYKRHEVAAKKAAFPQALLEQSSFFDRPTRSLSEALRNDAFGIIAEHKRRSPSRSVINDKVQVQEVASGYENAGASGMSVLTDTNFFGGSLDDLLLARSATSFPLLRKEFIIDPYQIYEAKAYGADAILLIAACLTETELRAFSTLATNLNLEVLLEVHNEEELQRSLLPTVTMLGVNNRNLKTFEVSIATSKDLSQQIPSDFVKISESGISSIDTIKELHTYGYQGFLIGETFMKGSDPGTEAAEFIKKLKA